MKPNITELVVHKDKCIGCGVCDAICPVSVLKMDFNSIGLYEPIELEGCLDKCKLCIEVCPFVENNESEKEIAKIIYGDEEKIQFHDNLGYFTNTYEVHKKEINDRLLSASGGAGHSILKNLLETKVVDAILSIESNDNVNKLFKFSIFKNTSDLEKARGSVYYPTEMSEVLDYILKNDGTYVITALPCYAKAIRLAQGKNIKFRKRVKFIVGLVCGQMKTKEFTHSLAKNTIGTDRLQSVRFRVKQENQPAGNFAFEFMGKENGSIGLLNWTDSNGPWNLWTNRAFTPNACNNCTDIFAHCADLSLMDAWLPEYYKDYRGHTLVIARTNKMSNIIESLQDVEVTKIDYKKVFLSQKPVVNNKNAIFYGSKNIFINSINKIKLEIQKLSNDGYEKNKITIELLLKKIEKIEKIHKFVILPKRVGIRIYRVLKGTR